MFYDKLAERIARYEELIEAAPSGPEHLQCRKLHRMVLDDLKETCTKLAVEQEKNAELRSQVFGNKNREKDEDLEDDVSQDDIDAASAEEKRIQASREGHENTPKKPLEKQTVRSRVPKGIYCKSCGTMVLDKGKHHAAKEVLLKSLEVLEREWLLHRGECKCGKVSFVMPPPERALEDRPYSPELIAKLIVDRYRFHLPIYRQDKQLADLGADLSRGVLNAIVLSAYGLFVPITNRIGELCRAQSHLYIDETPIRRVIRKISKRNYIWGMESELATFFAFTETRNQKDVAAFINSNATVLTDGLGIYNDATIEGEHCHCLAHLLQKLKKSKRAFPKEVKEALALIGDVYDVEKLAREKGLGAAKRLQSRRRKSKAAMDKLKHFFDRINPPPESQLGKCKTYALERWDKLTYFLRDGAVEVDNNAIERRFKDLKLGMKNALFIQSIAGGEAMAVFYTLLVNCERYNINAYDYIADVLRKLMSGWPQSRLDDLLPWNWQPERAEKPLPADRPYQELIMEPEELVARLGISDMVEIRRIDDPPPWDDAPPGNNHLKPTAQNLQLH